MYQDFSFLVVNGSSDFILSKEGVTQGDPLDDVLSFYSPIDLFFD